MKTERGLSDVDLALIGADLCSALGGAGLSPKSWGAVNSVSSFGSTGSLRDGAGVNTDKEGQKNRLLHKATPRL